MDAGHYLLLTRKCPSCGAMSVEMSVVWDTGSATIACTACGERGSRTIPPDQLKATRARLEKRASK